MTWSYTCLVTRLRQILTVIIASKTFDSPDYNICNNYIIVTTELPGRPCSDQPFTLPGPWLWGKSSVTEEVGYPWDKATWEAAHVPSVWWRVCPHHSWRNMSWQTQERSHRSVNSVAKLSHRSKMWATISIMFMEKRAEREKTCARKVAKHSRPRQFLRNIQGSTIMRIVHHLLLQNMCTKV